MQDEIDKLIVGGEPAGRFALGVPVWSEMGVRVIALRVQRAAQHRVRRTATAAVVLCFLGGIIVGLDLGGR